MNEFDWPVDPSFGSSQKNRGLPIGEGIPLTVIRNGEMLVVAAADAVGRYLFTGDRLWKRKYDGSVTHCATTDTAVLAAVEHGAVGDVRRSGLLARLAMASGAESWTKDLGPALVTADLAISEDRALVGDARGRVRCLDLRDGTTAWTSPYLWGPVQAVDVVAPDTVALAVSDSKRLAGLDILTGQMAWQHKFLGGAQVLRTYAAKALVHRLESKSATAALFEVDLESGTLLQAVGLKAVEGTPLLTGDDQIIVRRRAQIAKTDFTRKTLWTATLPDLPMNDGALSGQTLLHVLSNATAVAINTENGSTLWRRQLPGPPVGARPRPSGAQVCLLQDGTVLEINPAQGEISWSTKVLRANSIEIAGNVVCVSEDRQLYVVRT
ncbi:PQQ-binding-like beta-propeller repeat protein [Kribbella sp. NPDC048928]|uniref:outer membrane protein assembly factor BamB family protein n=1 Tax=Kribbella sp. NPDC048928 TaxID=3364111 RepID=UPI0037105D78